DPRAWRLSARTWKWTVLGVDGTMFAAGSVAAEYGAHRAGSIPISAPWMLVYAAIMFPLLSGRGLYRRHLQARALDDARAIIVALTLATAMVLSLQFLTQGSGYGPILLREWAFVAVSLL